MLIYLKADVLRIVSDLLTTKCRKITPGYGCYPLLQLCPVSYVSMTLMI